MIGKFRKEDPNKLDDQINAVINEMTVYGPDSEEYQKQLTYLERLMSLRDRKSREPVSWDTVWTVVGTLAGIVIIVVYEEKHVMMSKAFGFRLKNSGTSN